MTELAKLTYKVGEVEPAKAKPVRVDLGDDEFIAHCPNEYEYIALMTEVRRLEDNPTAVEIKPLIEAFFDPPIAAKIERRMRGANPRISLVADLIPCMMALVAHFKDEVMQRLDETQKKLAAPKA
jgi:hypothetical protein